MTAKQQQPRQARRRHVQASVINTFDWLGATPKVLPRETSRSSLCRRLEA